MTEQNNRGNVTLADHLRIVRGMLREFAAANALTYGSDIRGTINDCLRIVRIAARGFELVAASGMLTADDLGGLRESISELWQKYEALRNESLANGGNGEQATELYRANQVTMDEGYVPAWREDYPRVQFSQH